MPVDTSIYANQPKPVNPLEMMSSMAGLQGQIQQNQLLQRTMASRQAIGQAMQNAVGPDGQVDTGQFMTGVKADPNAAFGAVEAGQNALGMSGQQLAQHVQAIDLGIKQTGYMADQLGALADQPNVTGKDVTSLAGTLVQNGILDPKMAATELAQMPSDPAQIPAYLRVLQKRTMDGNSQLAAHKQVVMANAGDHLQPVNVAPLGDQGPVQVNMAPGEAATPVEGPVTATGAPTTVPKGQRAAMGTVVTGQGPVAHAAGAQYGGQVGNQVAQFEAAAREAPSLDAALKQLKGDLSSLSTGPGSDQRNKFVSAVNSFLGTNINANKVGDQESFNKMAAQVVAKQRQMMGLSGTDAQLSAAEHASPGSALSKRGNEANIALIRGNNDYLIAQGKAWEKAKSAGFGPQDWPLAMSALQKRVTPLPFQMQHMAADQRQELLKSMSAADRAKAAQEIDFARAHGLIPPKFDQ